MQNDTTKINEELEQLLQDEYDNKVSFVEMVDISKLFTFD